MCRAYIEHTHTLQSQADSAASARIVAIAAASRSFVVVGSDAEITGRYPEGRERPPRIEFFAWPHLDPKN